MDENTKIFTPIEIDEKLLQSKLYEIRGHMVMLEADLAEIYGYETKAFNQQVKRNKDRFDDDMMFRLSDYELEHLRSQFVTANISSKSRTNPCVFTEQGIYMLMTVLNGDLAVRQSKALVRTFKRMKDYILSNKNLIGQREIMQIAMQTAENSIVIHKLRMDIGSVEKQMSDIMDQLNDVVTKSELSDMMNSFVSDEDNGWLMYNAKYCSADVAYESIYSQAKRSVYLIDNYIGLRTLVMLKNVPEGVEIKLFSDNIGSGRLHNVEYNDFRREYPGLRISLQHTGGIIHDRFIVLDHGTKDERIFLCGASSKDAGARITTIVEDYGIQKYDAIIRKILTNAELVLP